MSRNIYLKRNYQFIVFFLLFVLLLISCSNGTQRHPKKSSQQLNLESDIKLRMCTNINFSQVKDKCIFGLALDNENNNYCDYITDSKVKEGCKSILSNDRSACENINPNFKNDCYYHLAIRLLDTNICDKATSIEDIKLGGITPSTDIVDSCKIEIASKTNNVGICSALKDGLPITSKDWCVRKVAQENLNSELCNQISEERSKQSCKNNVYKNEIIKAGNAEKCKELGFSANDCISQIAKNKKEPSLCANSNREAECLLSYIGEGNYKGDCSEKSFDEQVYKEKCLSLIALLNKDVSKCQNLKLIKDNCISEIATFYLDEAICKQLSPEKKDACFFDIAIPKGDTEVCKLMAEHQEECLKQIQSKK